MKEDKQKSDKLDAVKEELHQKVEALMGPVPEDQQSSGASKPEPKKPAPSKPVAKVEPPKPEEGEGTIDDAKLDKAMEEIAHQEDDSLLDEDGRSFGHKVKDFFKDLWKNPKKRKAVLASGVAIILLLAVIPNTRYFFLNLVGVRSSSSVVVLDRGTGLPLKNVNVSLANTSGVTNDDGYVKLERLKLGKTTLKIERTAFATNERSVTLGWGSNPLGEQQLEPVGLQYSFKTADFLSGKPIEGAEAYVGDASAFSSAEGEIILTLDTDSEENVEVMITAEGYRQETIRGTAGGDKKEIKMAPANKHVFVSKRSGKFDVYKVDADGQNEELVLSGTGSERDDVVVAGHPERNIAVLVSTREGIRNSDGFLLSTLTLIDLGNNKTTSLGRSERFQVVGWSGNRLIYVQISSGPSTTKKNRHRLISYDYVKGESTEIAASNYFNDVMLAQNKLYYAPSSAHQNSVDVALFEIDPDGQNKKVIIENEAWNLFRTGYDVLTIAVGQVWYEYKIASGEAPNALNGAPAQPVSRVYVDGADGVTSLWVDQRDGKGVLLKYDKQNQEDTVLASQSGLANPVRWLNNSTIVYRVSTEDESADYLVNIDGGESKKLIDVTDTAGVENWYYY